ncbi:MAG: hypothetical protein WDN06_11670 [Asticcacaulis sp.]
MTDAEALKLRRAKLRAWADDLFDDVIEIPKPTTPVEAASARRCVQGFDALFVQLWSAAESAVIPRTRHIYTVRAETRAGASRHARALWLRRNRRRNPFPSRTSKLMYRKP